MKRPIEPADIRAGDLIRCEWPDDSASEWRSKTSGPAGWNADRVSYFLLDRPSPPVELPTEPTLGWLTVENTEPMLDVWRADRQNNPGYDDFGDWATGHVTAHRRESVTAFKPAVAVPKAALDQLNADWFNAEPNILDSIDKFLTAVDEANRA